MVSGTLINRYFVESGPPVEQPTDLSGTPVRALVWDGGMWTTYLGTGSADGSFTVPGVPSGYFVLGVGPSYVRTEARTLDFGTEILGRPDAAPADFPKDSFVASLQNLAPAVKDDLEVLDNINGDGWTSMGPPSAGATSVTASGLWLGGLVDASKGDVVHVYQSRTTGPYEQSVIVRHAAIGGVEQQHGTSMVSGTLQDVTLDETLTLDLRGSEFAAQAPAISPNYGLPDISLLLLTGPGASQVPAILNPSYSRSLGAAPELLGLALFTSTDVTLSSVAYGNPFPADWGTMITAYEWAQPAEPKGSQHSWAPGYVFVTMPLAEATAGPVRPEVSPVQNLRIAGQDAFGAPMGTGLSPTITWDPPALGSPSAYRVAVYSVAPCAHWTGWGCNPDATVVTTETSVVMPPGVLTAGGEYQVVVTAEVSPIDVKMKPFRFGPRLASADAVSNLAMP
jgi:hypothetical protein